MSARTPRFRAFLWTSGSALILTLTVAAWPVTGTTQRIVNLGTLACHAAMAVHAWLAVRAERRAASPHANPDGTHGRRA